MNNNALNRMETQLEFLIANKGRLVADADTHITNTTQLTPEIQKKYDSTPNYYHGRPISAEDLICEMDMAGVDICLCWQNPATTHYPEHGKQNFDSLLESNRYIYESACKYPQRIIPTGWTDPKALGMELAKEMIRVCVMEFGCPVVKFNPAQNAFPIDNETTIELIRTIIGYGAIPAFHFAADTQYTPVSGLKKLAEMFPDNRLLVIHMGGGGASYNEAETMYHEVRELGLEYKNLFFIESAKRDTHIESDFITYALAGEENFKRIFCASDAPYGRMTWNYGGYRHMFNSLINSQRHTDKRVINNPNVFTTDLAKQFLGVNFVEFIIEQYQNMLVRYRESVSEFK